MTKGKSSEKYATILLFERENGRNDYDLISKLMGIPKWKVYFYYKKYKEANKLLMEKKGGI